jgi:hypothetical protein
MDTNLLNDILKEYNWLDLEVKSFIDDKLLIIAAEDLTYSHDLEIIFTGVTYVQVGKTWTWTKESTFLEIVYPDVFTDPALKSYIYENYYTKGTTLFKFLGSENQSYYVIANSVSFSKKSMRYKQSTD